MEAMAAESAMDYLCRDERALSPAEAGALQKILNASGVTSADHWVDIELGDLTIPEGVQLSAPLKALLRRTCERAARDNEACSA